MTAATEAGPRLQMSPMPHAAHWPPGVPLQIEVPDESLWAGFARCAAQRPHETGLQFLGRGYTWGELQDEALLLAGAMQHLGVQAGDRVLLFCQNCPQYLLAFHACMRLGAVVVPLNPMNKAVELAHYLRDSQAVLAIASSDIAGELAQAAAHGVLRHLVVFDLADALLPAPDPQQAAWPAPWRSWLCTRHALPDTQPDNAHVRMQRWSELLALGRQPQGAPPDSGQALALLPYTSGTTGLPKGCMHSHAALLHNALAARHWIDLRPGDLQLVAVPLFHITGLVMGMLASIHNACGLVLLPRWDRGMAAQALSGCGVTHWPNIPTMVLDLLSGDTWQPPRPSPLRYIGGGGAPMPEAVGQKLKAVCGLDYVEGYGLTETAAPTHINPMPAPRRGCLGIPFIGTQARIVDVQTLAPLGVDEVGEIVVAGPQLFQGYWHQPEATRQAFIDIDGTRYFRTGDMGRMDADGFFHMADRLKRMINASGFKVWPAEVEALLHHHPGIKESCVIAARDPYRGETVKALVVLHDKDKGQVRADDIVRWARAHMAAYKSPREVVLVDALPRTASGKVLWRQAQAEQDAADQAAAQANSPAGAG